MADDVEAELERHSNRVVATGVVDDQASIDGVDRQFCGDQGQRRRGVVGWQHHVHRLLALAVPD
jgi:hypothetical protein